MTELAGVDAPYIAVSRWSAAVTGAGSMATTGLEVKARWQPGGRGTSGSL